ncbi:MAG: OFA family MFS transporter [Lachnospiraceae bacterium]|nr:OFA family MFS transporter [Lachnospiraceae bacterium]
MNINNKWMRAAIPALLIHCSIGTVYCWSTFKDAIAERIGVSPFATGWAFSLAIFFLGMSAAFFGKVVERDIHKSALVSCICFITGFLGTGVTIQFFKGIPALILLYIFYGCIMGIGLGVGYLTPVKTLMLWFKENKGLATGISIMGFGLAKVMATPAMEFIQQKVNIYAMFYILSIVYFIMMFLGYLLLKKPEGWVEKTDEDDDFSLKDIIKNPVFIGIWLIFYINIHCGLMLITYEKQLLIKYGLTGAFIAFIPSLTAALNAGGRIGYATLSDKFKNKFNIYVIIFISSILGIGVFLVGRVAFLIIVLLLIINAGYGGGFSTLPNLLNSKFGMEHISKIHGLTLSAWAVAGITGNNTSAFILENSNNNYVYIFITALVMYGIALIITSYLKRKK